MIFFHIFHENLGGGWGDAAGDKNPWKCRGVHRIVACVMWMYVVWGFGSVPLLL